MPPTLYVSLCESRAFADLLAFWIGYSIIGQTYNITCFVYDEIQKGRFDLLLKDVFMWIRNGLLFSIWVKNKPSIFTKKKLHEDWIMTSNLQKPVQTDLCHTRVARSTYRTYDLHPIKSATRRITSPFLDPRLADRSICASHMGLSGKKYISRVLTKTQFLAEQVMYLFLLVSLTDNAHANQLVRN